MSKVRCFYNFEIDLEIGESSSEPHIMENIITEAIKRVGGKPILVECVDHDINDIE